MCTSVTGIQIVAKAGGNLGVLANGEGSGEADSLCDTFGVGIAAASFHHVLKAWYTCAQYDSKNSHSNNKLYKGMALLGFKHHCTSLRRLMIETLARLLFYWLGVL